MKTVARVLLLSLLVGFGGCVIDPSLYPPASGGGQAPPAEPPPRQAERKFVKYIEYANGRISYFRTTNSTQVNPNRTRICFENNTGQPKSMVWRKVPSGVNNMVVRTNGARSCVNLDLNQRVEWTFFDRMLPVKADGMNIGGVGGMLIEFIWVKDY